jgi:uncharacterized protein YndB with AHSA1/START domain
VPENALVFSRDYDLPQAIVWDALVDEVLIEGWLAVAHVEQRTGGSYQLVWQGGGTLAPTNGIITTFEPSSHLVVETDNIGILDFTLDPIAEGTRGSATALTLRLTVDTERKLLASTVAYWRSNFDQLEDLLRGHPVDWSTWQEDRGGVWAEYLRSSSMGR